MQLRLWLNTCLVVDLYVGESFSAAPLQLNFAKERADIMSVLYHKFFILSSIFVFFFVRCLCLSIVAMTGTAPSTSECVLVHEPLLYERARHPHRIFPTVAVSSSCVAFDCSL